VSGSDDNNDQP